MQGKQIGTHQFCDAESIGQADMIGHIYHVNLISTDKYLFDNEELTDKHS